MRGWRWDMLERAGGAPWWGDRELWRSRVLACEWDELNPAETLPSVAHGAPGTHPPSLAHAVHMGFLPAVQERQGPNRLQADGTAEPVAQGLGGGRFKHPMHVQTSNSMTVRRRARAHPTCRAHPSHRRLCRPC